MYECYCLESIHFGFLAYKFLFTCKLQEFYSCNYVFVLFAFSKKRPLTAVFVTSSTFFLSYSSSSALHVYFLIALTACNTLDCIGVKYYLVLIYTKELKVTPCVYVSLLKKASVMPL